MENVWLILSKRIYDGPSFHNNNELLRKLNEVIFDINNNQRNILINLYGQIRRRMCQVLQKNGNLYNTPSL